MNNKVLSGLSFSVLLSFFSIAACFGPSQDQGKTNLNNIQSTDTSQPKTNNTSSSASDNQSKSPDSSVNDTDGNLNNKSSDANPLPSNTPSPTATPIGLATPTPTPEPTASNLESGGQLNIQINPVAPCKKGTNNC